MEHAPSPHPARRLLIVAVCVSPIVLLAGAWWIVDRVLLSPALPDEDSSAADCVRFVAHERGLPRLDLDAVEVFLRGQLQRIAAEPGYVDRLAGALRRSTPEEAAAFREHIFGAFKPLVLRDINRFHEAGPGERQHFLDQRIVEYNRMARFASTVRVTRAALGSAAPEASELLRFVLNRTTPEELSRGTAYLTALAARIETINADPALRARFEALIADAG